ncbi:uncharacterized protein LOC143024392 [Oratosquilla oratoria]|uniref:uncharacterized protein LOC143024392 n=1 Tax=Oratosquilla oratoria TaxID=337810 RepID=UPI003F7626AF
MSDVMYSLSEKADQHDTEKQCRTMQLLTFDIVFSLRQLQKKRRELRKSLYIAFIDLTKAVDLVRRDGLLKILAMIGCPPTPLILVRSFQKIMKETDVYDATEGIYLQRRPDDLLNLSRLRGKTKVERRLLRDLLFAGDAELIVHTSEDLQPLLDLFAAACDAFGLTMNL